LRECLPLILILRNRLKYAITGMEAKQICMSKHVKVDGKIRTDPCFPAGFMDVVEIEASSDKFRLLYDTKGRFRLHRISDTEKAYKLCRVQAVYITAKKIPVLTTHDGPPSATRRRRSRSTTSSRSTWSRARSSTPLNLMWA
jgi:small subunit ribosomal protein S4e